MKCRLRTVDLKILLFSLILSGCLQPYQPETSLDQDGAPLDPPENLASIPDATPKWEAKSRYGNPETYEVFGVQYKVLPTSLNYRETGIASWYGTKFHGKRTSSGSPYDMYAMTAAHKTLPLPTYVRVKNLENGKTVVLKVNDRGPFHAGRIIDLSYTAAHKLGIAGKGTGRVEVTAIHLPEPDNPPKRDAISHKGFMYIQVGAFSNRLNAEILQNKLMKNTRLGDIIISDQAALQPDPLYRVQLGPIESQMEVNRLTQQLSQLGIHQSQLVVIP